MTVDVREIHNLELVDGTDLATTRIKARKGMATQKMEPQDGFNDSEDSTVPDDKNVDSMQEYAV